MTRHQRRAARKAWGQKHDCQWRVLGHQTGVYTATTIHGVIQVNRAWRRSHHLRVINHLTEEAQSEIRAHNRKIYEAID